MQPAPFLPLMNQTEIPTVDAAAPSPVAGWDVEKAIGESDLMNVGYYDSIEALWIKRSPDGFYLELDLSMRGVPTFGHYFAKTRYEDKPRFFKRVSQIIDLLEKHCTTTKVLKVHILRD